MRASYIFQSCINLPWSIDCYKLSKKIGSDLLKRLLILSGILLCAHLSGCSQGISISEICKDRPELCEKFTGGGHCNEERSDLIYKRYDEFRLPSDRNRYKLLVSLEDYTACIALASQIEHIKLKEKKTERMIGYLAAIEETKRVSNLTRASDDPYLLFYHWSRNANQKAIEKFLEFEGTKTLENSTLQYFLATYYSKKDTDKTLELLKYSLELRQSEHEPLHTEVLHTLSSLYYKKEDLKLAYIWAKIADMAGSENVKLKELELKVHYQGLNQEILDNRAANLWERIQRLIYKSTDDGTIPIES